MNTNVKIIFGLLGGLGSFLFGMNMMSESLKKAAGARIKAIMSILGKNPLLGLLVGVFSTAILQSSSATTVMVIGFVSADVMSLPVAIAIIFGANIGTTITAQIIAFKLSNYIYVFIFIGFLLSFIVKNQKSVSKVEKYRNKHFCFWPFVFGNRNNGRRYEASGKKFIFH